LWVTRFPSVRAKPATRPLRKAGELYHNEKYRVAIWIAARLSSYFPLVTLGVPLKGPVFFF
jgi:hypothetical protein